MRVFSRGLLTDELLTYLRAGVAGQNIEIGDGIAPPDAGWQGGQPGVTNFKAYAVLNASAASTNFSDTVRGNNTSWKQPYTLLAVGGSRQQCDWASDVLKPLVDVFNLAVPAPGPRTLDLDGPWKVLLSNYTSLGAPSRNDQVDPPVWQSTDAFVLFLEHATP